MSAAYVIHQGDCLSVLQTMEAGSVQTCVTSPPYYGLRSYLPDGVKLKKDAPDWVRAELEKLGIFPIHT